MSEDQILVQNLRHAPVWVRQGKYDVGLDQYYTKKEIARYCYNSLLQRVRKEGLDLSKYTFLEPSAGTGVFLNLLPKPRIGLDLHPKHPEVRQADFLKWQPQVNTPYIAIGNPPFGHRAWLALAFMQYVSNFCDLVGFILPMYFQSDGKGSAKHRVRNMNLLHSEELPYDIFESPKGKTLSINTVWQIWSKQEAKTPVYIPTCDEYVDVYTVCTAPSRRCGLQRMQEYHFFIQSTFYRPPKIVTNFNQVQYGSGYGIIIKKEKKAVTQALQQADWQRYSIRATNNCRHISMQHIKQCLCDAGLVDTQLQQQRILSL